MVFAGHQGGTAHPAALPPSRNLVRILSVPQGSRGCSWPFPARPGGDCPVSQNGKSPGTTPAQKVPDSGCSNGGGRISIKSICRVPGTFQPFYLGLQRLVHAMAGQKGDQGRGKPAGSIARRLSCLPVFLEAGDGMPHGPAGAAGYASGAISARGWPPPLRGPEDFSPDFAFGADRTR